MDARAMTLLDTNVIVDAMDEGQEHHLWAWNQIKDAVSADGGGISAVTLAELYAWERNPAEVEPQIRSLGITVHAVPAEAAAICGAAYRRYATARRNSGGSLPPKMPLADFFIGAHAEVMGWKIATRDQGHFEKYFPSVVLLTP
jgi:predicted nucleic acid-binding protein